MKLRAFARSTRIAQWFDKSFPGFDTEFEMGLLENYASGRGGVTLDQTMFRDTEYNVRNQPPKVLFGGNPLPEGFSGARELYFGRLGGRFDGAFGTATGHFVDGRLVGFFDSFDFNSRPFFGPGSRGSVLIELGTRASKKEIDLMCPDAASFEIKYP